MDMLEKFLIIFAVTADLLSNSAKLVIGSSCNCSSISGATDSCSTSTVAKTGISGDAIAAYGFGWLAATKVG
ncbi:hypothetical protein DERP_007534 [Dermatophagoides pteronyssinus]|uniref:Uncharacterized protein n=1 Tax=Dermatophagoides pteronyssinus TaxID=6956 RepID=A0ABQ8JKH6_DERPT|nr:hypothetical protein DERP_007534 [Dermatophagoides pteronyssinus]